MCIRDRCVCVCVTVYKQYSQYRKTKNTQSPNFIRKVKNLFLSIIQSCDAHVVSTLEPLYQCMQSKSCAGLSNLKCKTTCFLSFHRCFAGCYVICYKIMVSLGWVEVYMCMYKTRSRVLLLNNTLLIKNYIPIYQYKKGKYFAFYMIV